ncbi:MAG: hypothetical protein U0324_24480 [Polyangiales bacterium]
MLAALACAAPQQAPMIPPAPEALPLDIEPTEAYFVTTEPGAEEAHRAERTSDEAITLAFAEARRGRWLRSARAFLSAAEAVRFTQGSPSWEVAARNRARLYRNAAYCFQRADASAEAQATFRRLTAEDAAHAGELEALRARFAGGPQAPLR